MTVLLIDDAGRRRMMDIPDHLHRLCLPVELPTVLSLVQVEALRRDGPSPTLTEDFTPTGEWWCTIKPSGVSSIPVWRQVSFR